MMVFMNKKHTALSVDPHFISICYGLGLGLPRRMRKYVGKAGPLLGSNGGRGWKACGGGKRSRGPDSRG